MTKPLDPKVKAANKIKFGKIRSERMKGSGNHFFGKHHSKESKEKNRASHVGLPPTTKGRHHTDNAKKKLRLTRIGKPKISRKYDTLPEIPGAKCIPLTKDLYAIVDSEDYERINANLWISHKSKNTFYARRALPKSDNGNQLDEKMHHAIIGKPPMGLMIDHINGNGLDNRKTNLRIVTNRQNCRNRHQKTKSIYPGVTFNNRSKCWVAQAQINGKHIHIGSYPTEELAYEAYCKRVDPLEENIILKSSQCQPQEVVKGDVKTMTQNKNENQQAVSPVIGVIGLALRDLAGGTDGSDR